jgi:outer membrane lipoprotein-sorting protein
MCCVLLGLGSVPQAFSSDEELQSFLKEIQDASDEVKSFSSAFVQERRLALFTEPVIFHGSLTVVRPDKLRWEFTSPVPSVLIFSGEKGMRCNADAPPVNFDLGSDPIMRTVAEQLWLWLGGDYSRLGFLYKMEKSGPNTLTITPKEETVTKFISSIAITFNKSNQQPENVEIAEPGGDTTTITFQSYVLNSSTPDILFTVCGTDD